MTQTDTATPLDESIERATGITTVLGGVFLFGGILQAMGLIQAGVPAWLNILLPIVVLVLAPRLKSKSLLVTGMLAAIFLVLVVDTLAATGYVLNNWGMIATGIVVIRYIILLSAAQELAQVMKHLFAARTTARRVAEIRATKVSSDVRDTVSNRDSSQSPTSLGPAGELRIDVGNNSAAAAFRIMAIILPVGGFIFGSAMMAYGETGVGLTGLLVMTAVGIGTYFVAGVEERFIPDLIAKIRNDAAEPGGDKLADARTKLIATKHRGSRALAAEVVNDRIPVDSAFADIAFSTIAEIGILDDDAAFALKHYIGNKRTVPEELRALLPDQD